MSRPRTASIIQEEKLMSKAKDGLKQAKDPIEKLRFFCLSRGTGGIMGFGKIFRRMDNDGSRTLNHDEFSQGIRESGLELPEEEEKELFKAFDKDGTRSIDYDEFLITMRPPMSENRVKLIELAYEKLDKSGDGIVTVEDLKGVYNVDRHPLYLSGEKTEDELLKMYLRRFEGNTTVDGKITKEEFFDYYAGVSASIDHDAYFDLMMRNSWGIK